MFFSSLALESSTIGSKTQIIRVLNYAPGPMDTMMQTQIRNDMPDGDLKTAFVDMHTSHSLVDPFESAKVLCRLLAEDTFESGSHLDYYDLNSV
jgi:sepiapterin reductase